MKNTKAHTKTLNWKKHFALSGVISACLAVFAFQIFQEVSFIRYLAGFIILGIFLIMART